MDMKRHLMELIDNMPPHEGKTFEEALADHLIASGVIIPQRGRWLGGYYQKNGQFYYRKPYCSVCGAEHDGIAPYCEKCGSAMTQKEG